MLTYKFKIWYLDKALRGAGKKLKTQITDQNPGKTRFIAFFEASALFWTRILDNTKDLD
jgi:hypothetical protein